MSKEERKRFRLRNLRIHRVAMVDRGANPEADVVLFKRDEVVLRDYSPEQRKEMASRGQALSDGSFPIADEADLKNAIQAFGRAKNKAAARAHIVRRARALGATDSLPEGWVQKEGGTGMAELDMATLEPEVREHIEGVETELQSVKDELEKARKDAEAQVAEAVKAELEKRGVKDAEPSEEDVLKSADPAIRKMIEDERKAREEAVAKTEALEKRVEASEIEKRDAEFSKRVEEWRYLTVKPEEFGPVLRKVADVLPEEATEIERILRSANALASEGLRTIGKDGSGPTEADEQLAAMAKAAAEKEGISEDEAMTKVISTPEGAALYEKRRLERLGR